MSHHPPQPLTDVDKAVLGAKADRPWLLLTAGGAVAIIVAFALSFLDREHGGGSRFAFAYTVGFAFALAITLGNLFFVIITTLFRAGWCAAVRRVAEVYAANIVTLIALFIPVLACTLFTDGALYPWTKAGIHAEGKVIANHNASSPFLPKQDQGGYDEPDAQSSVTPDATAPWADLRLRPAAAENQGASENTLYAVPKADGADADTSGHDAKTDADAKADAKADPHAAPGGHANPAEHGSDHPGEGHGDHADHGDHAGHGEHHIWTHTAASQPHHNHAVPYFVYKKGPYLTRGFYSLRWVVYFALWGAIGLFYYKNSVRQDQTGDVSLTNRREWWAPLSVLAFAITVTLASFDLLMSIDPVWYSTMFGVYFFAGAFTAGICTIILTIMAGQKYGYFPAVNTEHFHDLGKLLFAFVFFWGYVGFSQFMLIWYASLPETTYWWEIRGVTSVTGKGTTWTLVAWLVLFGHLLIPFALLLSKHVKRNRKALMFIAIWMLFMCWVDLFWVTMPALVSPNFLIPVPELLCGAGCVSILVAGALKLASRASLTAYNDPRMHESLGLDTTAWAPIHVNH